MPPPTDAEIIRRMRDNAAALGMPLDGVSDEEILRSARRVERATEAGLEIGEGTRLLERWREEKHHGPDG